LNQPLFIKNEIYRRSQIHDQFGGSRQGGISHSATHPYIFIFSGQSGHQHGYKDQWENDNVFSYTGEGQINDMQFIRGNLALRDHLKNEKRVFLFIQEEKGFARFETELELEDFDFFVGPDREGHERTAIKFFFKRAGSQLQYQPEHTSLSFVADSNELFNKNIPNITERQGLVTSRVGQGAYRKSILLRWKYRCAVTNYSKKEILIASHIVSWKDSTNEERLDVDNGILLSPTYDALFDQRLISFENSGKIILSDSLSKTKYESIGVTSKELIKNFSQYNYPYLERHRNQTSD
jgi:5-methylcytosine-specific restriction enzyme A